MSWLLDINILLASRWDTHAKHEEISTWLDTLLEFHTTPIVELGFLRISLSPAYAATWEDAHRSLTSLLSRHIHRFLPDDVSANDSPKSNYKDTTKPIGVAEYQLVQSLPERLQTNLPSIEEIEAEFAGETLPEDEFHE